MEQETFPYALGSGSTKPRIARQEQPRTYRCWKFERVEDLQMPLSPTFIFQVLKDQFCRGGGFEFSERLFMRQHRGDAPNKATSPRSGSSHALGSGALQSCSLLFYSPPRTQAQPGYQRRGPTTIAVPLFTRGSARGR